MIIRKGGRGEVVYKLSGNIRIQVSVEETMPFVARRFSPEVTSFTRILKERLTTGTSSLLGFEGAECNDSGSRLCLMNLRATPGSNLNHRFARTDCMWSLRTCFWNSGDSITSRVVNTLIRKCVLFYVCNRHACIKE
jgi:hypothetical protein